MRALTIFLVLWSTVCRGQDSLNDSNTDVPTITVNTQLVIEHVTVRDNRGQVLRGLTSDNFVLTEDASPQQLRVCEFHDLASPRTLPEGKEPLPFSKGTTGSDNTLQSQWYSDHRLLALYFDMSGMAPDDKTRALLAAKKFITSQMSSVDALSIIRNAAGSVDVLQDFTDDRQRLLQVLTRLIAEDTAIPGGMLPHQSGSPTDRPFGQDDAEFSLFNTNRQLSVLQTAIKTLGRVTDKKFLLYFSSGLGLNGITNETQLHAVIDAAVRNGVAVWPIDARGLVAEAPFGGVDQQVTLDTIHAPEPLSVLNMLERSRDALYSLGVDTGGRAFFDFNDLSTAMVQAEQSFSSYYVLGYYSTNSATDGKFRTISISLRNSGSASIEYRRGYYAPKHFTKFTGAEKERQLEDALMVDAPLTDLSLSMEIDYFQINRAEYFVPVTIKIPGGDLLTGSHKNGQDLGLDIIGEVKNGLTGRTIVNVRDKVSITLHKLSIGTAFVPSLEYDTGFTLLPGQYKVKLLARENSSGKIGTAEAMFRVPNLNRAGNTVPISSVVMSTQMARLSSAVYDTSHSANQTWEYALSPLVQNGQKMVPSITRTFGHGRSMHLFFQAYSRTQDHDSVAAYVMLYHNGTREFETEPIIAPSRAGNGLTVASFNFVVDLEALLPGNYDCEVVVLDPNLNRTTFWQTPIQLLPE